MKTVKNWASAMLIIVGIVACVKMLTMIEVPEINPYAVVFFGVSSGFAWVYGLRWGIRKPFNCAKCMSGWFCLFIAFLVGTPGWFFYLPVGVFFGFLIDAAIQRYL